MIFVHHCLEKNVKQGRSNLLRTPDQQTDSLTGMTIVVVFNGEGDHVHLLVSYPPKISISNFAGKLKGKSSYFLRREFKRELRTKLWGVHLWSPSYCAVACGGATLEILKEYIQNQQQP